MENNKQYEVEQIPLFSAFVLAGMVALNAHGYMGITAGIFLVILMQFHGQKILNSYIVTILGGVFMSLCVVFTKL